ncbi:hypothetical protein [Actinomycetospora cinnamomea]|uniref:hypothetical protein n=1 Tax=Actinomycetospora cinnamomea TaxID=663609 RepID=UPI0024342347|nr:hypothetical protein [Actinomycetospora cinnamomea]
MSTVPQAGGAPVDGVPPLLRAIVDDATLVAEGPRPEMADAVDSYLAARGSDAGSLLGSLVVPVSRLSELVAELVKRRPAGPVPVALSVDTGLGGVPKALSLTSSRAALLDPRTVEMPAPHDVDTVWLERVTEFVPEEVVAVVEPRRPDADGSEDWLDGVRRVVEHGCRPKLRCGGGRAGAFPGVRDVAGFLALAVRAGRSFTASIGLQAAVRHTDPGTGFTHHGWLNLLVATVRALATGPDEDPEERIGEALLVTDGPGLAAELAGVDQASATRVRALFSSFGSTAAAAQGPELARLGLL